MKRTVGLALALAAGLAAAGCSSSSGNGIASESVSQIQQSVEQAVNSASSVQINGSTVQSGKTVTFQVVTFSSGDFSGSLVQSGNSVMIKKIGSNDYLNGSAGYYQSVGASASEASALGGIWVYGPDSQLGFGSSFTIASVVKSIKNPDGTLHKGSASTIDGQAAFSVTSSKGGSLWVATTGKAYPIELDNTGTNGGTVKFVNWNQGTSPVAPPGAKAISSLG
jgi:hypothetical protein